ncbi:MAG: histidinol-phosphate transaminase [Clostridia bacterium]|nr:histidinol-phosphate transaminase [Clostridia bacterium]
MSKFLSKRLQALEPYVPGEQPKNKQYIKLNTNENAYPLSAKAAGYVQQALQNAQLYPDPECTLLREKMAAVLDLLPTQLVFTNGSDEILNFAFMAFCEKEIGAAFADITYGFYPVFADCNGIPYKEVPLREDLSLAVEDYRALPQTLFIANPNAPTGLALSNAQIEALLQQNPARLVVVDEAYADFAEQSALALVEQYDNLLVTGTFSKSRSGAGLRLGFGAGNEKLIEDINRLRYATNPYNINALSMAAALGVLEDEAATKENCARIKATRAWTCRRLRSLGFACTDSQTNFLFAKHPAVPGERLYLLLKEKGILVRHFSKERIREYIRITIGTEKDMETFINTVKEIIENENSNH